MAKRGGGSGLEDGGWGEERLPSRVGDGAYSGSRALRRVYVVLGLTTVSATAIVLLYPQHDLVDRFGANVATEAAAILVTLVFVHRFLQQQDRERRLRASIGALRRASHGLIKLNGVWMAMLKGALPTPTMERPRALPALYRPNVTEHIAALDPHATRGEQATADDTWVRWASAELRVALGMLHDIILAYAASLDPAYVEAVDDLIDDPFVRTFADLVEAKADERAWRARMNAARAPREAHFARLVRLLELHNELARQAGRVRAAGSSPRSGVLGLNLEPDHDLKVGLKVEPELWDAGPDQGSLRADTRRARTP